MSCGSLRKARPELTPYSQRLSGGQSNVCLTPTQHLRLMIELSVQECERVSTELKSSAEALLSRVAAGAATIHVLSYSLRL